MNFVEIRFLMILLLSILSFPALSGSKAEYGEIIKNKPEYEKITTPRNDDDRQEHYYHYPYSYPYSYPYYPYDPHFRPPYYRPGSSGRVGLPGAFYFGVAIGETEFNYADNEDADASIFHFGYRPKDSRLGYELSFFDSGHSEVTSLTDIDIQVDTFNLALTLNSSRTRRSRLNFFGQGGIYFADTTLTGPFDSVSKSSNGYLLAIGVEIMLNRHFSLRAEAYNFFDVEDFANDESISSINLGAIVIF